MSQANDFLLAENEDGIYDLVIEDGQFVTVYSFETALDMVFFCERRAEADEVPLPQYRRGWWGNKVMFTDGYEIGSKLWLLVQGRLTDATLNKAVDYLDTACQWLVEDGYLAKVEVKGDFITYNGFREGIQLSIVFTTLDGKVDNRYYDLWKNVNKSPITHKVVDVAYIIQEDTVELDPATGEAVVYTGGKLLIEGEEDGIAIIV
jgi:phage gp46-like protein